MTDWNQLLADADGVRHTAPPERPRAKQTPEAVRHYTPLAVDTWDAVGVAFAEQHKNELRYSPERGMWLIWDKHLWRWDELDHVREIVKAFGRGYQSSDNKGLRDWGYKILNHKNITQIINLAKSDPRLSVKLTDFDSEVYELNTPAGVVDLWEGTVAAPAPSKLVKRSTTVAPDSNCPTPLYKRFMAETFAGDPELSEYVETMLGLSLIMAQDDQVFLYMHGLAGSGKGTLMTLAQDILGKGEAGYSVYVDSSMFIESGQKQHPTEMMQFLGARMAISSEISQGQRLDTGKLKKTTGGDPITGRYMGKDFVTFDATHTLWLMANDRIQVPLSDGGVWRRLREVPFNHSKAGTDKVIQGLGNKLFENEGSGILAIWIARATKYLNQGYYTPQSVIAASEAYKAEQDTIAEWLEACADTSNVSAFTSGEALRDSYAKWCRREGRKALGSKTFAQELEKRGHFRDRRRLFDGAKSVTRVFTGIQLAEGVPVNY